MNLSPAMDLDTFIRLSLLEDTGHGDHSTLASVPASAHGRAVLVAREPGFMAGLAVARAIFAYRDPQLEISLIKKDGDQVAEGEHVLTVAGSSRSILNCERLVLNCMQRMSGIATLTSKFVEAVQGTGARILDTRKTTPLFRAFEKEAVRHGGGYNHRMGLYDRVMLKDNHIDFAGGIGHCIRKTAAYLEKNGLDLQVEIEVRNMDELEQVLAAGHVNRILLDNFSVNGLAEAVRRINGAYETEASGGITLDTARSYALTGVGYLSVGALTHSFRSLDLSLIAAP